MFRIAWSELYRHQLPPAHRFPMEKYELLPQQLMYEGTINQVQLFVPMSMGEEVLLYTHDADYLYRLKTGQMTAREMRRIGFPYSEKLVEREIAIMFGTVQAALYALEDGIAFNLAGGTHHAYADKGEGFCVMNDIAVAANYLLHHHRSHKILVVDLDVHQGNGTAALFCTNEKVFTFSMHGRNNYPMHKEESDLDIALDDKTTDSGYLLLLADVLPRLIEQVRPDFIFYQSGVDVLATDKLGRLGLSLQGCLERDNIVLTEAHKHEIPLTVVMGGGYSPDIRNIIEAHAGVYRLAKHYYG